VKELKRIDMAFKMNKPVIKGTKNHSALLATAKASGTVDPTLGTAAEYYGESMNPDVIDYTIKQTQIEWDKKEEVPGCTDSTATNYNPQATKNDGSCEYEDKEDEIDYDALNEPEKDDPDDYPGGPDDPNKELTPIERKKISAENDKEDAKKRLEDTHEKRKTTIMGNPTESLKREGATTKFNVSDKKEEKKDLPITIKKPEKTDKIKKNKKKKKKKKKKNT